MDDKTKQEKNIQQKRFRTIALLSVIAVGILGAATTAMIKSGYFSPPPPSDIYGTWVEQGVPKYAADMFIVSKEGIRTEGRLISTDFEFDGHELTYQQGEVRYRYVIDDLDNRILLREEPAHYRSKFVRE